MTSRHRHLLGAAAVCASFVFACSSEEQAAPSRPPVPPPVTEQPDGGTGEGGAQPSDCFDATKNEPKTQKDFLNQCNGAECFAFDNGARIEGYTAGAPLPPLN